MARADADATLAALIAKYLAVEDTRPLVSARLILPDSVSELQSVQDLTLTLSDGGALGGAVPGAIYRCGVREISPDQIPPKVAADLNGCAVSLIDVSIDRSEAEYTRSWTGFARRRWERNRSALEGFVRDAARGAQPSPDASEEGVEFLRRVAKAVWDSPFENYSRFTGQKLAYKTGDESILNMIGGGGAICSEKVQALKFLTDEYGFESRCVFAGPDAIGPMPEDRLRQIIESLDFRGAHSAMRYWQHTALEYVICGKRILVDATNGNIPFLFMPSADVLDGDSPKPVRVRMGTYSEDFYYHRAPDDLAMSLFYMMENFVPEIDLVQVFDNELGLAITEDFLVSPLPYRTEEEFESLVDLYRHLTESRDLDFDANPDWHLDGPLGETFQRREPAASRSILDSHDHLLSRYEHFEGAGCQMGLAVVQLR